MSAIEMMDPKMDAGMLCNRGNKKANSFDQSIEDGSLLLWGISNSDLIGIIDTTLACMVSWLEGHSLAQTVFTNLYLHKPYLIEDRTLKAFCIAIYKLLDIIKDYIQKAMVYEEEDFQGMQYGYYLYPDVSEQRVVGMLHEVEEELDKEARALYSNGAQSMEVQAEEIVAIYSRIKFVRVLYQTLLLFVHKRDEHLSVTPEVQR
ncbi:N-alpha-acetyltransferase 35, NatC auxiliary subunit-like [Atheta coriaria]|uniref:N-alpha-acetyltransferase 35, NatC auxiliary subunit-like n=1 Tax=Dalotia coriaria TaxID=877792 RepID=UPI0031F36145